MSTLTLLSPFTLGPLTLPNRVVMAPMTRNRAGPGNVPGALNATYYAQRAGAGLIVSEATQVSPQGLVLTEVAPGVDVARDVLGQMAFAPHRILDPLPLMDAALFDPETPAAPPSSVQREALESEQAEG